MTTVRNSQFLLIVTLLIAVCLFNFPVYAKYSGGTGEPNDPHRIATAGDLMLLGDSPGDYDKHFILTADINLDPNLPGRKVFDKAVIAPDVSDAESWFMGIPFTGFFNGNNHTISNMTIEGGSHLGLFGQLAYSAEVSKLRVVDVNITGTGINVGGLCGHKSGVVRECYVSGTVSGNSLVGGLIGQNWGITTDCAFTGQVSGEAKIGGLVGFKHVSLYRCYACATVSGSEYVGGLVGYHCCGTTSDCYAGGHVTGDTAAGGLMGLFDIGIPAVADPQELYPVIANCYSVVFVEGREGIGGLVGKIDPDWPSVFLWNTELGSNPIEPGLVIYGQSFWDIEVSGQTISAIGIGKTTAEMQTAITFLNAGWDFVEESDNGTEDIWWIDEGRDYPRLWWEFLASYPEPHNDAIDVELPVILSWIAGGSDLHHDIYFGEDKQAVTDATTQSLSIYRGQQLSEMNTYELGVLEIGKTYYWRIDECSNDVRISKGNVWSFTTANFLVVDDFEDYNNYGSPYRIFDTWVDGYFDPENGSQVGYDDWESLETWIVHSGRKSMPYIYNTDFKYSEATRMLVWPRDWTQDDVGVLSLWFYGGEWNDTEQMYIAIANIGGEPAAINHDDPGVLLVEDWTEWTIDLIEFSDQGVDLTDVDTISIGFGDKNNLQPGGEGVVLFDDIRLYRLPPEP